MTKNNIDLLREAVELNGFLALGRDAAIELLAIARWAVVEAKPELEKVALPFQGHPNESNVNDWKSEALATKVFARSALAAFPKGE